jgi:hypothetical protein
MRDPNYNDGYHSPQSGFKGKNLSLWEGCVVALDPGLGNTGTTVFDHSGNANHGTLTNLASTGWAVSEQGLCLEFDATNDYLKVPYHESLAHNCYSWSIWVKSTYAGGNRGLIGRWQNESSGQYSWAITWENTSLYWYQRGLTGFGSGTLDQNDGKWHHLAGTYDKNVTQFWLDGVAKGSVANTGNYTASTSSLVIGNYALAVSGTGQDWDGQWRSAAIWNRALSPGEICELASDPAAMYQVRQRFTLYQPPIDTSMLGRSFSGEFAGSQIAGNVTAIGSSISGESSKAIASSNVLLIGSGTSGEASTATTIGNCVCLASSFAGEVSVGYLIASGVAFAAGVSGESSMSRTIASGVALGRSVSGETSRSRTIANGVAFSAGRSGETSKAWVIAGVVLYARGISGEIGNANLLADSTVYAKGSSGESSTARVAADSLAAGTSATGSVGTSVVGGDTVIVGCSVAGNFGTANTAGAVYGFGAGVASLISTSVLVGRVPLRTRCVSLSAAASYSTTVVADSRNASITAAATYSAVGAIDQC